MTERREPKLRPCPFCGANAVFRAGNWIHCANIVGCGAEVHSGDHGPNTMLFTVESWNRREAEWWQQNQDRYEVEIFYQGHLLTAVFANSESQALDKAWKNLQAQSPGDIDALSCDAGRS